MMDEKCLSAAKRRKIEDTVLQILKASDLETTTELSVRSAAAGQLGFELSGLSHRRLVRQLVDSFLLSTAAEVLRTTLIHRINDGSNTGDNVDNQTKRQQPSDVRVESEADCRGNGKVICKLSDKTGVAIHDMNGTTMVEISDFNINDGKMLPERGGNSGISLTATQWSSLRNSIPSIQEAILKLESRSRSVAAAKPSATEKSQTEAGVSKVRRVVFPPIKRKQSAAGTSEPTSKYQKQVPASRNDTESNIPSLVPHENSIPPERKQTEADISTSVPSVPSQGHLRYTANAIRPERLIPIQTTRFNGKYYHSWRHQMELFLNQLNIAYVLSELCPSAYLNPEASSEEKDKVKSKIQRWNDDDYLCRHSILNSLSDNLFQLYSRKSYSARELWEELKSVYDDDFGTTRSQINKYIHFQMVDGVPILKQAEELRRMADSIINSGTYIEESFHVSVIVSKLPPSWKEFRARLMQEDFLPLNMLMHRLRVEEESRNSYKKDTYSKKDQTKFDSRLGWRKCENKRVCVCYSCGKEGHVVKNCPDKLSEDRDKNCRKENEASDKVDASKTT
ncbi:hypothetical protein ACS0TY_019167 [Phlomoides rotata]